VATLVLSTVGTVLGGPVGGAIGALIGQAIDQAIFGRRGPRVGDLGVQTSSYGTHVPRVYGTMRIAGSVIWATDLVQSAATSGAKGQPDTTYSYAVSFAVALASRPLMSVKRIWADGKLIRDEDEVFKVPTTFRFYEGSENQAIDPLIGSIEGIANTPAYRGLALAVFENLELAEFGNRIPFLTFEVSADEVPPSVELILGDATAGLIACSAPRTVVGYAAYGRTLKSGIESLVDSFAVELVDDGARLRSPGSSAAVVVSDEELGSSADAGEQYRIEREQRPIAQLPAHVRVAYYDPARDYQTGEARASAGDIYGSDEQVELAAVMDAGQGKSLAQQLLARRWANRDKLTVRLPPKYLALEPGARVELALTPPRWVVERCTVDRFGVVVELTPSWLPLVAVAGGSGRVIQGSAVGMQDAQLALIDAPDVFEPTTQPTFLLAASSQSAGWKSIRVDVAAGTQTLSCRTAARKTVLGSALSVLSAGNAHLLDSVASVDVELIDHEQWLTSCDDEALVGGGNLAILGGELIQFGDALPLGAGRFRLGRLVRGRGGTEWAMTEHGPGEPFALIERDALQPVALPAWLIGSSLGATLSGPANGASASIAAFAGESCRPLSPVRLQSAITSAGALELAWTRRSRRGWAWIDQVDAPLGETREQYRITVEGTLGSLELTSDQPTAVIAAADLVQVGSGPATIEVRQIGDLGASRPATSTITIS
jgi:hypothetical protein